MHFTNCDVNSKFGSSNSHIAFVTTPDTGYSYTRGVYVTGCSIHDTYGGGMYIGSMATTISNTQVYDTNKHSSGTVPALEIGSGADDVIVEGGLFGQKFGDSAAPNYGILINNSVTGRVAITGANTRGATVGSVDNLSGASVGWVGGLKRDGAPNTATTCASATSC